MRRAAGPTSSRSARSARPPCGRKPCSDWRCRRCPMAWSGASGSTSWPISASRCCARPMRWSACRPTPSSNPTGRRWRSPSRSGAPASPRRSCNRPSAAISGRSGRSALLRASRAGAARSRTLAATPISTCCASASTCCPRPSAPPPRGSCCRCCCGGATSRRKRPSSCSTMPRPRCNTTATSCSTGSTMPARASPCSTGTCACSPGTRPSSSSTTCRPRWSASARGSTRSCATTPPAGPMATARRTI